MYIINGRSFFQCVYGQSIENLPDISWSVSNCTDYCLGKPVERVLLFSVLLHMKKNCGLNFKGFRDIQQRINFPLLTSSRF